MEHLRNFLVLYNLNVFDITYFISQQTYILSHDCFPNYSAK